MEATTSTLLMRDRLAAVLERIDKELDRSDSPHTTAGTAYVGGITKLGAALDHYLLEVWRWLCARAALAPELIARRASPSVHLPTAGAGQLLHLLTRHEVSGFTSEQEVRWVCAEACRGSALANTIALRNDIVHGRVAPNAKTIRRVLEQLRNALAPQLALLAAR